MAREGGRARVWKRDQPCSRPESGGCLWPETVYMRIRVEPDSQMGVMCSVECLLRDTNRHEGNKKGNKYLENLIKI